MYSGTTFHGKSGHVVGVHQRIDRLARRNVKQILGEFARFPTSAEILHFEGNRGPDALKRKNPGTDEPWHFVDPDNPDDRTLESMVEDHIANLAQALRGENHERAAFEAAWLSHAIVDGLTPAHQYPLADKIEELWGTPHDQRDSIRAKNLIIGDGYRDSIRKNWEYWGAKGVFSTHVLYELGVASSMASHRFRSASPSDNEITEVDKKGYLPRFRRDVQRVYDLNHYETFWKHGWTHELALATRRELIPVIVVSVSLAWLYAYKLAQDKA